MSATSGPTFLLIGAARSGTTSLMDALGEHPEIDVSVPKEPHYLAFGDGRPDFRGPGDEETLNRRSVTDRTRYLDLFDPAYEVRGEGSVSTLYYAEASVERIRELAPDARLFVILRDPADRAFSAYQYLRARGFETEESFSAALDAERARIDQHWHHLWHYVEMGRYGEQLQVFHEAFGPGRVTVLFFEDLADRRSEVLAAVHERLGVSAREAAQQDALNASGEPRSAVVQRMVRLPDRHPRLRAVGSAVIPRRLWHRLRQANLRPREVAPEDRARIDAALADDRLLLRSLIEAPTADVVGRRPDWLR